MKISLTPELEQLIQEKVNSGQYRSAVEVIHEGLQLLRERDVRNEQKLAELRGEIDLGLKDLEQGRVAPVDAEKTLAGIRARRSASAKE
ncbi:MAG TPA: type II toxin-antitoxin system ParD family antitoxin [Gemmataceae bacterium]|nr:type II toxin-antitoxin system ParD family antitoxin [Gemmataceae bacterium]